MPKQTTDHCPANDKVLETKEDSTVTYISCENALAILVAKWQATKEELAAWVFLGPEQGGLAAFLDAYQLRLHGNSFIPIAPAAKIICGRSRCGGSGRTTSSNLYRLIAISRALP